MKNENEIDELLKIAVAARLEGCDFLSSFTYDQLADGYNGIGPEFLPPLVREKVSEFLHIFKPAAVVHDLRNELSNGTRDGFRAANDEFYRNCIRLADCHYPWYSRCRYRARAAALVLYAFVSAEHFGWRAWLEAKDRHAAKMASGNSAWKTKEDNMKKLMLIAALAALAAGCGVKKINYEKKVDREGITTTSYRIYQNDHWLNTKASAFKGGMTSDGKFEFEGEGLQSSPSEEFNRTMQTYTTAFVQLAQIAAAAYNPSASAAASSGKVANTVNATTPAATNATVTAASAAAAVQPAEDCPDCVAK